MKTIIISLIVFAVLVSLIVIGVVISNMSDTTTKPPPPPPPPATPPPPPASSPPTSPTSPPPVIQPPPSTPVIGENLMIIADSAGSFELSAPTMVYYGPSMTDNKSKLMPAGEHYLGWFGPDPYPGVFKHIFVKMNDIRNVKWSGYYDPNPGAWVRIAQYGQSKMVMQDSIVKFGSGTSWIKKKVPGGARQFTCSNDFFGADLTPGNYEACYTMGSSSNFR